MVFGAWFALVACGGERRAGTEPTVRDSAGITIVENPPAAVEAAPRWDVAPEPIVDVGTVEGPSEYQLSAVQDVVTLSDGTLVVAHDEPPGLRFYAPDGSHLRTVGGEGEGPGEFRTVAGLLRLDGDTLLAHDWRLNRLSRFAPDGTFLGSVHVEGQVPANVRGRMADGTLVMEPFAMFGGNGPLREGAQRQKAFLLAYAPDGTLRDTLLVREGREYVVNRSGDIVEVMASLFTTAPYETVSSSALYTAHSRAWEIRVRGADGTVRRIVRLDRERRPVTGAVVDSVVEERLQGIDDPNARKEREAMYREMPVPEERPAFDAMRPDAVGNLWLREVEGGSVTPDRWIVFGPEGSVRAVATLPARFTPHEIHDDRLVGTWTDELDVSHVRIYRLRKGGAEG